MSTVIQKYKKLINKKQELELKHQHIYIDLDMSVKSRKRLKGNYSTLNDDAYKSNFTPDNEMLEDISRMMKEKSKLIQKHLNEMKENKAELKKVNIKLSSLLN